MPANPVFRKVTLAAAYAPLSATSVIADITIKSLSTNTGSCFFQGDDSSDVELEAGGEVTLLGVDLAEIKVKGTVGEVLSILGATRS